MFNAEEIGEAKKNSSSGAAVGIGGTLIMVIFVALCLTIFATLSFTTAYSDLKLSKKTEQMTKDYYLAHKRAEEKLSEVYEKLLSSQNTVTNNIDNNLSISENFKSTAKEKVTEINGISILENENDREYYSFTVYYEALGNLNQKICVTLNIFYDEVKNEPYYEIVSWNLANINLPSYNEEVYQLWEGID